MAQEIFVRAATQLAGVFSADQGRLSFGGGVSTALVQNINATYMQNVTRLYEVGNTAGEMANVYYVGGRSQGTMAIARVVGPSVLLSTYYKKFGDVCQAKTNTIELIFDPLDCDAGAAVYTCKYCVIVSLGLSVAAQDMVVNENSQLMFSGMEYGDDRGFADDKKFVSPAAPLNAAAAGLPANVADLPGVLPGVARELHQSPAPALPRPRFTPPRFNPSLTAGGG